MLDAYFTFLSKQIIDEGIIAQNPAALVSILIHYGGTDPGPGSAPYLASSIMVSMLGERIRYDLRQQMFNHLQILSLSYYSNTPVGWIMSRVTTDSDRVAELVTWGVLDSTWG